MKLQDFKKFSPPQIIQPTRTEYVLQAFTLPVPTWVGASDLLAEYALNNTASIAIKIPVKKFGANFVLAVRWKADDIYYRYVFWEDSLAVLYFPTYHGETIPPGGVLEIWSINSSSAPALLENEILESSVLVFPANLGCNTCCAVPVSQIPLVQTGPIVLPPGVCNPFCGCDVIPGTGACIVGTECTITTEALCIAAGGVYQGDGVACPVVPPYDLPAWPVPTPFDCPGAPLYSVPIEIQDPTSSTVTTPGINYGTSDPITYINSWGLPGCLEAWAAAVWQDFITGGTPYSQARLVWQDVHTSGFDFMAIQVYPNEVGPYAHVSDLDTKIVVEYCP